MTRDAAYRRTLYHAGDVVVRIGQRSPSADRWMSNHGAPMAGFITAWNPLSRRMPTRWNAAAQSRLRRDLRRHAILEGDGTLGRWTEAMLLTTADPGTLRRLMHRHRQAAIVLIPRGRPAALAYR